ncbi:MAG: alpha/beta hydrolase [Acidimicrobiales bacterium mtb01]|nr:alpha/beta hydrolase [Actinomycetota bacterium]TEX48708.1 MAG: alpha/beta hydrolase [Acidimicrobiales bacterium mtb01]
MTASRLLLVHGAWHGAWCWERLIPRLRARGLDVDTIDLPSHGPATDSLGDLYADADAVRSRLDAYREPVLLVGHSYGGMVITDTGAHEAVAGLVYLCAFLPSASQTLLDLFSAPAPDGESSSELVAHLAVSEDGNATSLVPDGAAQAFYADCDPADQQWALGQLDFQGAASATQAPRQLAWQAKPTTYVVCSEDRAIPAWQQRAMALHANHVVELRTSHSPFLAAPGSLAEILVAAARAR